MNGNKYQNLDISQYLSDNFLDRPIKHRKKYYGNKYDDLPEMLGAEFDF